MEKQAKKKLPQEINLTEKDAFILIRTQDDNIQLELNRYSNLEALDLLKQCQQNLLEDIKKEYGI